MVEDISAIADLQRKIIEAQSSVFAAHEERAGLLTRIGELEKE